MAGPWWRELLPRRRRGPAPTIVLPDGSAVPSSFAAAVLGRLERTGIERRRHGLARGPEEIPGRLGRAAWGAGLRPSVDSVGPRAEALLRAWVEGVDDEPPRMLCALEAGDRVAFLLQGWITPRTFPRSPIGESAGTVSFRVIRKLQPSGLSGGAALVAASVRGSLVPRLRPSPAVSADGLLVPVGFSEEGCLYLPLLGTPISVSGERAAELLAALAVYAQMRMGPEGCLVLATEPLRPVLDPVIPVDSFEGTQPREIAQALLELALHRRRRVFDVGALTHREAALSPTAGREPVVLGFLDAETARQARDQMPDLADLGVGVIAWGEEVDAPRRVSVSDQEARVCTGPDLEPLAVAPALLSGEAMAAAAAVLRSAVGAARTVPAPPGGGAPVAAPTPAARAPTAEGRPAEAARGRKQAALASRRRVVCFGGVRVFLGSEAVEGGWRTKALELLALLATRPEGLTREQVLTALWPDADPVRSGDILRQCLRQIRQRLEASEAETMVADWVDERLRLDAGAVRSVIRLTKQPGESSRGGGWPAEEGYALGVAIVPPRSLRKSWEVAGRFPLRDMHSVSPFGLSRVLLVGTRQERNLEVDQSLGQGRFTMISSNVASVDSVGARPPSPTPTWDGSLLTGAPWESTLSQCRRRKQDNREVRPPTVRRLSRLPARDGRREVSMDRGDETQTGRREFLRRVGQTLAVGLGLALIPGAASAQESLLITCCRDSSCPNCPGPEVRYRCHDSAGNQCGCICTNPQGNCFTSGGFC